MYIRQKIGINLLVFIVKINTIFNIFHLLQTIKSKKVEHKFLTFYIFDLTLI